LCQGKEIKGRVWKDDRGAGRSVAGTLSQRRESNRLRHKSEKREATSKGFNLEGVRLETQTDSN